MADKADIRQVIKMIERFLEKGDTAGVVALLAPDASPDFKNEIENNLGEKKIHFIEKDISSWTSASSSSVKVNGNFSASGFGWEMSGSENYFIFEKFKGRWLLVDTDSYRKLSPAVVWTFIRKIMSFAFPVFIITFAFWVWMLADCLNRPIKDKLVWVLAIIFLNILGALLYFFIERKKNRAVKS